MGSFWINIIREISKVCLVKTPPNFEDTKKIATNCKHNPINAANLSPCTSAIILALCTHLEHALKQLHTLSNNPCFSLVQASLLQLR